MTKQKKERTGSKDDRAARKLTVAELNAAAVDGAFTRETLAAWGVPWPPPPQWQEALIDGRPMPVLGEDGLWKNTRHSP